MNRNIIGITLFALIWMALPGVHAQNASSQRVLRTWIDNVKLDDGSQAVWNYSVTYDTETGEYAETVVDESGALVQRTVGNTSLMRPTSEEIEMARAVIFADPVLSRLYEEAANPELEGGFVLQREQGHPCGPGSRCLQFDMFDVDNAARQVNRIRYIVVDVRDGTLVSDNFDPSTDGNATRFNGNPAPTR